MDVLCQSLRRLEARQEEQHVFAGGITEQLVARQQNQARKGAVSVRGLIRKKNDESTATPPPRGGWLILGSLFEKMVDTPRVRGDRTNPNPNPEANMPNQPLVNIIWYTACANHFLGGVMSSTTLGMYLNYRFILCTSASRPTR